MTPTQILLGRTAPDAATALRLLEQYPYYSLPAAMTLKHDAPSLDEPTRRRLSMALALTSSEPESLYMLLEQGADAHAGFYPDATPPTPSTNSVIDTFLDTYGSSSPQENATLERLIFNPTPDYAQLLAQEEQQSVPDLAETAVPGSQDDRLNRFILRQKESEGAIAQPVAAPAIPAETVENRVATPTPAAVADDSLLSESLARVFIRQKQFSRAYEIISQLNLKYPEKSAYFADQLRFLRKLIASQKVAK